ncbi:MAG: hypothetical protein IPN71_06135 [Fibrobacteres bacterium]|nr:hypothetical protein [Fibrobacterota bacterium]
MSTNTLLLAGKPGTGKLAPGKVTPLKGVKAKPELTQQLVVKQAAPHTPDIPHWEGAFPFPKDIVYHDERDGKLIADLSMKITTIKWTQPRDAWGAILAMAGTTNYPFFKASKFKKDGKTFLCSAVSQLDLEFSIVDFNSSSWKDGWGSEMERLTGRFGLSPEERRYWIFRHEMDHFSAWSHFFRFMLGHIFSALNEGFPLSQAR